MSRSTRSTRIESKKHGGDTSTSVLPETDKPNMVAGNKRRNPQTGKAHRRKSEWGQHWENGLRRVREARNRSQGSLGPALGIDWSPANISKLERSANPQIALLLRYAEALGVNLHVCMVWDDVKLNAHGRVVSSKRVVLPLHFDPHTHIDGGPV